MVEIVKDTLAYFIHVDDPTLLIGVSCGRVVSLLSRFS